MPALLIGCEPSALGRAEGSHAAEALRAAEPGPDIALLVADGPLRALRDGRAEIAVISAAHLPSPLPDGTVLSAVLPRGDPREAFASAAGRRLRQLPAGARVAVASRRRAALLATLRPDIEAVETPGDAGELVAGVERGEYDGALLAAAELDLLGRQAAVTQRFDTLEFPPAPGQGALALLTRAGHHATVAMLAAVDSAESRAAVEAELAFLAAVRAGCDHPAGAFAQIADGLLALRGMIAAEPGGMPQFGDAAGATDAPERLGGGLGERMLEALAIGADEPAG